FYNNHSFRGSIDISPDSLAGFTSDYNVVMNRFTTNGGDSIQTLSQWQSSTGQDQHSLIATPSQLFVNPAGGDYHLSESSPAIDVGTSQYAPNFDFEGTTRPSGNGIDIGADEREDAAPPPPPPSNQAPTDILLTNASVRENSADGTVVGLLSAVDPDSGDTHSFVLTNGAGSRFRIAGNQLMVRTGSLLDFEAATSHTIVVRTTDSGGLMFDKSFVINVQNVNELVGFDVQRGLAQRSYIRYIDLVFESADGLAELIAQGRFGLTRYNLNGANGVNVSLTGKATASGNRIVIDFGAQGIGGKRNSATGDGYYALALDTDDDGSLETVRNFYRLLGDSNGDRIVDATDVNNVNAAFGATGPHNADLNGDGVVNATDRNLANRRQGRKIASHLLLHD
ncbi:MAG TPA: choice-of-anchor Q domain-containing protein, partial [Pirellulaceae bacterium]|nr:choice-of-anchor Q domain-containing protein [Pirellulaceae bacterium]